MLRVLSLFSGIGAYEKALKKLKIPHEIIGYCEINEPTAKAYSLLHNVSLNFNYRDVTKIDEKNVPDFDILTYSPPCQAFSIAGKQSGFEDTRGILFFDALRIIKEKKPKVCIMENVKNLSGKRFEEEFDSMLQGLEEAGYKNYYKVLNSKYYNIPQNRERLFLISIREDLDIDFKFPRERKEIPNLFSILEENVPEYYFLSNYNKNTVRIIKKEEVSNRNGKIIKHIIPQLVRVRKYDVDIKKLVEVLREGKAKSGLSNKEIAKQLEQPVTLVEHWFRRDQSFSIPNEEIWLRVKEILLIDTNEFDKAITTFEIREGVYDKANRVYDIRGISPTLTKVNAAERILIGEEIRTFTPLETLRLMGFTDEDYDKLKNVFSDSQIYGMCGNSVVVNVLEEIFKELPLDEF